MAYNKSKAQTEQKDYQVETTNRYIKRLEEIEQKLSQGLKWEQPIFKCNEWPVNGYTGEKYHGGNVGILISAEKPDARWFTFNQIQELNKERQKQGLDNLQIQKGSKAEYIMRVVPVYEKDEQGNIKKDENGNYKQVVDENNKPRIGFKFFPLFNGADIKGLEPYIKPNLDVEPAKAVKMLTEALIAKDGLTVEHTNGGTPHYQPGTHKVGIPKPEFFKSTEHYHDTLTHELAHSTSKTLGRDVNHSFGTPKYAFEELVAEMTSSFMAIELGLKHDPSQHENQIAYVQSWLKALSNDKTMIFRASNQASKATEFQMAKLNEYKLEQEQKSEQSNNYEQTPQERIKFQFDRLEHQYYNEEIYNPNRKSQSEFMKDGIADYIQKNQLDKPEIIENFKKEFPELAGNIDEKRIFNQKEKELAM